MVGRILGFECRYIRWCNRLVARVGSMPLGFGGEVAALYQRYRHGYPSELVDELISALGVGRGDLVVDLGCGTGQLTLPVAARVRAMIGVDPEPDMLVQARLAANEAGVSNISWMMGTDRDLPALRAALDDGSVAALTVGQALHWMAHRDLFVEAHSLLRGGGGIAVLTNGTPLWMQNSYWSRRLHAFLERWLDCELTACCGTDEASQTRYREDLANAGYRVLAVAQDYVAELDFDALLGGVLSAMPRDLLPHARKRRVFADGLRAAVGPAERFDEPVHVSALVGRMD